MRLPANNALLMISSTILATLLWLGVGAEERSEIVVSVPLEYRNLPKGFEISTKQDLLSKVNVWVRGGSATIKNLQPQDFSVWIDLKQSKAGEEIFPLSPENVKVPFGLTVLRVSPPQVSLAVEQIERRMVPVVPRLIGEPSPGFAVTERTSTPAMVEIIGPRSAVQTVREAVTDSIDVDHVTNDVVSKVKVGVENNAVRLGNTHDVSVYLKVSEIEDILTLRHVLITAAPGKKVVKFNPRFVRVDIRAPKRLLKGITEQNLTAVVDLEGLNVGVYELTPRIEIKSADNKQFSVQAVIPERVHVRIQ